MSDEPRTATGAVLEPNSTSTVATGEHGEIGIVTVYVPVIRANLTPKQMAVVDEHVTAIEGNHNITKVHVVGSKGEAAKRKAEELKVNHLLYYMGIPTHTIFCMLPCGADFIPQEARPKSIIFDSAGVARNLQGYPPLMVKLWCNYDDLSEKMFDTDQIGFERTPEGLAFTLHVDLASRGITEVLPKADYLKMSGMTIRGHTKSMLVARANLVEMELRKDAMLNGRIHIKTPAGRILAIDDITDGLQDLQDAVIGVVSDISKRMQDGALETMASQMQAALTGRRELARVLSYGNSAAECAIGRELRKCAQRRGVSVVRN